MTFYLLYLKYIKENEFFGCFLLEFFVLFIKFGITLLQLSNTIYVAYSDNDFLVVSVSVATIVIAFTRSKDNQINSKYQLNTVRFYILERKIYLSEIFLFVY